MIEVSNKRMTAPLPTDERFLSAEAIREHQLKRADELEVEADEIEEEAWEAGDLEERLDQAFQVQSLRRRAARIRAAHMIGSLAE